jgi:hypothetical protein
LVGNRKLAYGGAGPVYKSVGFYEIGRMVIEVAGDDDKLYFAVLLRPPKGLGDTKQKFVDDSSVI